MKSVGQRTAKLLSIKLWNEKSHNWSKSINSKGSLGNQSHLILEDLPFEMEIFSPFANRKKNCHFKWKTLFIDRKIPLWPALVLMVKASFLTKALCFWSYLNKQLLESISISLFSLDLFSDLIENIASMFLQCFVLTLKKRQSKFLGLLEWRNLFRPSNKVSSYEKLT